MSTPKHTRGPWTVQEREHSFRVVDCRALKFDNSRLCDVQHWSGATRGPDREESRANARLIAAAPELLEAAKQMQGWIAVLLNILDADLDSVEIEMSNSKTGQSVTLSLKEQFDKASAAIAKATGEQE